MTGVALGMGTIAIVVLVLVLVQHHHNAAHPLTAPGSDQCMFCHHRRSEHRNLSGDWTLRFPCLHHGCTCPAFTRPDDLRKG